MEKPKRARRRKPDTAKVDLKPSPGEAGNSAAEGPNGPYKG